MIHPNTKVTADSLPPTSSNNKQDALFLLIHCNSSQKSIGNLPPTPSLSNTRGFPAPAISYGWSDFPLVYQYHENDDQSSSPFCVESSNTDTLEFSVNYPPATPACTEATLCLNDINDNDDYSYHQRVESEQGKSCARVASSCTPQQQRQSRRGSKKQVSFSNLLEIRCHEMIVGDHPCCSDGLPLSLGWDHSETELVDIDSYQQRSIQKLPCEQTPASSSSPFRSKNCRQQQRLGLGALHRRRLRHELRLNYWERVNLLERTTGLTEKELLEKEREYLLLPSQRRAATASLSSSAQQPFLSRGWPSTSNRLSTIFIQ